MKYIIFFGFLVSPLILLNYFVFPELTKLQDFYSNIDQISQQAAGTSELQTNNKSSYTSKH